MRIKLNRAARKIMEKKIWRDKQIKGIVSDLSELEDTIRDNWTTVGYVNRGILYLAHAYIKKHMNLRDKRVAALENWIQELDKLLDERASFSSCLR